ncbi:MAG: hypothetical protein WDW38_002965 [Sanguina aurantia]
MSQFCLAADLASDSQSDTHDEGQSGVLRKDLGGILGASVMEGLQSHLTATSLIGAAPASNSTPQPGMKPFSNSSSPSSLSQQSHQPLSPEDATHLASILLFQLETQPPMLQPHAEDVLRVYSAALPAFGIAQADLAVRLATAVVDTFTGQHSHRALEPRGKPLQSALQAPRLCTLIDSGMQHVGRDSSLDMLTALIESGVDLGAGDGRPFDGSFTATASGGRGSSSSSSVSNTGSGSGNTRIDGSSGIRIRGTVSNTASSASPTSNSSERSLVSCLLLACVTAGERPLTKQQLLSLVQLMLYVQIPPSQPQAFVAGLCLAVAQHRSVPSRLLLLLPQAAALCHAPLPQGFMRSYESALEKLMREEQQEPGSQKSKHAQGTSSMSTVGHFQGTLEVGSQGEIGKVVPQLVSMVLQPLLLLHQPVTSQLLLKAVVANWSASAASLHDGRSGQASTEQQHDYPGVLAAAAVILQTVSQGPSAPTGRLQDMLNAMATEALQLAVAETSHSHASVLVGPCVAESAALLNAVGTYSQRFKPATALLPSPPRRVGRLQPPPLQNSAATAAAGAATVNAASCGLHRDAWLRGMMTVLRVVGQGDCLPGQPWVGLSTADLISVSHTIAVELSGQQGQESVLAVFRDYLAGPVPAGIAAQGLETVG